MYDFGFCLIMTWFNCAIFGFIGIFMIVIWILPVRYRQRLRRVFKLVLSVYKATYPSLEISLSFQFDKQLKTSWRLSNDALYLTWRKNNFVEFYSVAVNSISSSVSSSSRPWISASRFWRPSSCSSSSPSAETSLF